MNDAQTLARLPFSLQTLPKGATLLHSPNGSSIVHDEKLVRALRELETLPRPRFGEAEVAAILERHGLPPETLERLLDELAVIAEASPVRGLEQLMIVTDQPEATALLAGGLGDMPHLTIATRYGDVLPALNTLVVLFHEHYSPEAVREAYAFARAGGAAGVLTSYVIARTAFIDGLYMVAPATPCHFCHMARAERLETAWPASDGARWRRFQTMLRSRIGAESAISLNPIERGYLLYRLRLAIRRMAALGAEMVFPDELLSYLQIDLEDGREVSDILPHWPDCECLRPGAVAE